VLAVILDGAPATLPATSGAEDSSTLSQGSAVEGGAGLPSPRATAEHALGRRDAQDDTEDQEGRGAAGIPDRCDIDA
jgi:hypothetical protein